MPKYEVQLTRDATESVTVIVEAPDPETANERAEELAGTYGENLDNWELDDGSNHEVYFPDAESTEEVTDPALPLTLPDKQAELWGDE
jgi:ABC-type phosphate transport system substrate-binding protein